MSDVITEVITKFKAYPGACAAGIVLTPILRVLADGRPASVGEIARAIGR